MSIKEICIILNLIVSVINAFKDKYDVASFYMLCAIFLELL